VAKIADLVRQAQEQLAKAKKDKDSIERVSQAITTIHDVAQIKGKQ
jgi:hypothetical protein